jgi:ribonuclease D
MDMITDTGVLTSICAGLETAPFLAVDFEFMRENSYYPKLCLIQMATPDAAWIIDPLARGLDLTPFWRLMTDSAVLKVFHAGGQDLEIVFHATGRTPQPLFDTQVAGMALGLGEQVGYQQLIQTYLRQEVDKGARFTDWARRPLEPRQLDYALGDVTHLSAVFPRMLEELIAKGRGDWLDEEMARLADPTTYRIDPDEMWKRLKLPSRRADVLGRLKALARWRELQAQSSDIPRMRMMKDETLVDLASHPPRKQADLARVRGLSERWATNEIGASVMAALDAAQPLPSDEIPDRDRSARGGKHDALVADLLKLLLKIRCDDLDIAPKLIARGEDLEALVRGERDIPLLNGWRLTAFGQDALGLLEGRTAFQVVRGRLRMMDVSTASDSETAHVHA